MKKHFLSLMLLLGLASTVSTAQTPITVPAACATCPAPAGTITALNCAGSTDVGTITEGAAATGVSTTIPYTGGDGGAYTAYSVTSTGVTGLTASIAAGTFATGSGSLTVNISGTPTSSGTASFVITIGGQTCTITRTVAAASTPGTITALNCASATHSGTLTSGIAASGVSSSIPYTGGNGQAYSSVSVSSTGVTGLTLSIAAGTFAVGSGNLTATITGTPASSGTASFVVTIGGQTCTLTRTVAAPPPGTIAALNCSSATNSGSLFSGSVASGVSSSIPYTGGDGGTYSAFSVASTGVTGLTLSIPAGTFAVGSGSLTGTITGTPSTSGTASFVVTIGGQTCTLTRTVNAPLVGSIASLNCTGATHFGTLTSGTVASGVYSTIGYTGGNGGSFTSYTVASTGVTGLTATISSGTFTTSSGSITVNISGTPASSGTASFTITLGGQTCTLTRVVNAPVGTITTLACSTAVNNGTLRGGITASGVNSIISYTGGNGGTYSGQTVTSTGVTGLTATLSSGTFASGSGTLTYNITGTPAQDGLAYFAINIGGQTCTLVRIVGCGAYISSTVWKVFMCHDLGANTSLDPHVPVLGIHGAYIQWGKIGPSNWATAPSDGPIGFAARPTSSDPGSGSITGWSTVNAPDFSWKTSTGGKGAQDPCPSGWRIPTHAQWSGTISNNTITRTGTWTESATNYGSALHYGINATDKGLTLPASGAREPTTSGGLNYRGTGGYKWASDEWYSPISEPTYGRNIQFGSTTINMINNLRLVGQNIRCIKE